MTTQRLGLIMNGVTGRMGLNQHLIRSIVAIREQGGVRLKNGDRVMPDPILVGRNADKIEAPRQALRHRALDHRSRCRARRQERHHVLRCRDHADAPGLLTQAINAGKHVYCEKPIATNFAEALEIVKLANAKGVKHGTVQDKLFLPGLKKIAFLRDSGFFGRMLSVRGEFGYWVFEGGWQQAQRPSWNYRDEDGGGIILDMVCHWRYVLDNLFGEVESVVCIGNTDIPERFDEQGKKYKATADDSAYATFQLEGGVIAHINMSWVTRVYRDDLVTFQVDGTHGSAVAGLSDCMIQPRQATPRPVWNPDEKRAARFLRRLAEAAGQRRLRQRLQGAVGDVHPPRLRGRALQVHAARRRQGRAARRMRAEELERAALDRRRPDQGLRRQIMNKPVQPMSSLSLKLPKADRSIETYRLAASRTFPAKLEGPLNRIAFSAAHTVADPSPTTTRGSPPPSTGTRPSPSASTSGTSASASPRPWTPRSAAWGWTGRPRWS